MFQYTYLAPARFVILLDVLLWIKVILKISYIAQNKSFFWWIRIQKIAKTFQKWLFLAKKWTIFFISTRNVYYKDVKFFLSVKNTFLHQFTRAIVIIASNASWIWFCPIIPASFKNMNDLTKYKCKIIYYKWKI